MTRLSTILVCHGDVTSLSGRPDRLPRTTPIVSALVAATSLAVAGTLLAVPPSQAAPATPATSIPATSTSTSEPSDPRDRLVQPDERGSRPVTSGYFNNPLGSDYDQERLVRYLIRSIDATDGGEEIRFANYSLANWDTGLALKRAYERGVRVQVIVPRNRQFAPIKLLRNTFGSNPRNGSFVKTCKLSCRGSSGEMHAKFFQFSNSGGAEWVTMTGSLNLTTNNTDHQWSDLFTLVGNRPVYVWLKAWFLQMRRDKPLKSPYRARYAGPNDLFVTPIRLRYNTDPVVGTLNKVECNFKSGGQWRNTALLLSAYAWNGERGKRIARQVADLARRGCKPRVFFGDGMGGAVVAILRGAGVPMTNGKYTGRASTHQKLMIVVGRYNGHSDTVRVLTGSQNWSDRAALRDDLMVRVNNRTVGRQYVRNFWYLWRNG